MQSHRPIAVFSSGFAVGTLGGLIGLGGAEFRLPLLIGLFGFDALSAVILNKALSLVVVASSLPFRMGTTPLSSILERWDVIVTLLAGSLIGAWCGAAWATKLKSKTLYRVLAVLLLLIAVALLLGHELTTSNESLLTGVPLVITGIIVGFWIGVVAALMGVAGGELLIPTIVLLFGADIKLAGSLSLAVSLPTMIVGFTRYSRDNSFSSIKQQKRFLLVMAAGSLVGAYMGGRLLGVIPTTYLLPMLAGILLISSVKVWQHSRTKPT